MLLAFGLSACGINNVPTLQEQGVELDFGLLMERQTVGAWWDAVAAGRAGA